MKVHEIMAVLAQMDPDCNCRVAAVIDGEVIVDTIVNVKPSFAGPLIQTTGFAMLLREKAAEAGIVTEDKVSLKVVN